jgi:hypothetical protein
MSLAGLDINYRPLLADGRSLARVPLMADSKFQLAFCSTWRNEWANTNSEDSLIARLWISLLQQQEEIRIESKLESCSEARCGSFGPSNKANRFK